METGENDDYGPLAVKFSGRLYREENDVAGRLTERNAVRAVAARAAEMMVEQIGIETDDLRLA